MSENVLFEDLTREQRACVQQFQQYVVEMVRSRAQSWPISQRLIQAIAQVLSSDVLSPGHPVNLRPIATRLHARVNVVAWPGNRAAADITPTPDGFDIAIRRATTGPAAVDGLFPEQVITVGKRSIFTPHERFSLAHELGHVFFYRQEHLGEPPQRIVTRRVGKFTREEGLCHDFARALLIPTSVAHAVDGSPSLRELLRAARDCAVSPEVCVRRLLHDCDLWPESLFVRLSFETGVLRADCFRGRLRPAASQRNPGRRQVMAIVGACDTVGAAVEAMRQRYDLPQDRIAESADRAWFEL